MVVRHLLPLWIISFLVSLLVPSVSCSVNGQVNEDETIFIKFEQVIMNVDPVGRVSREIRVRPMYAYSPYIHFFRDKKNLSALEIAKSDKETIAEKFNTLEKVYRKRSFNYVREKTREIEQTINSIIGKSKSDLVRRQMATAEFYRLGVSEFSRRNQFSELEKSRLYERLQDIATELERELKDLENKIANSFFRQAVKQSPKRIDFEQVSPVRVPFLLGATAKPTENSGDFAFSRFEIGLAGTVSKNGTVTDDPLGLALTLISAQQWQFKNEPTIKFFLERQFEELLRIQTEQNLKQSEIRNDSSLTRMEKKIAVEELRDQSFDKKRKLAEKIINELNEVERREYLLARILCSLQRNGYESVFEVEEQFKELGFELKSRDTIARLSSSLREEIVKEYCQLHHRYIEEIVIDCWDGNENQQSRALQWNSKFGAPPLEMLINDIRGLTSKGDLRNR